MFSINASETLILASAVIAFSHVPLAIAALSLGTFGALVRYSVTYGEKQQRVKEVENTTESLTNLISGLAAGMGNKDRSNLH